MKPFPPTFVERRTTADQPLAGKSLKSFKTMKVALVVLFAGLLIVPAANAQKLRFTGGYRELAPPDYATLRIGPMYSSIRFDQSAGYRYTASTTDTIDELDGLTRGIIKKDGAEFPLISTLTFQNYIPLSRRADLDASFWFSYSHYPLETQEDQFIANFTDEEISANFLMEYQSRLTPYLRVKAGAQPSYSTDFVDLTGQEDIYGGERYERFENIISGEIDLLIKRNMGLAVVGSRSDVIPQGEGFSEQRRTDHAVDVVWEYEPIADVIIGLSGSITMSDYSKSEQDEYVSENLFLSVSTKLNRYTSASLSLGQTTASTGSSDDSAMDTESESMSGSFGLIQELSKDLSHSLAASRNMNRNFLAGIDISDSYSYNVAWKLSRTEITCHASYSAANITAGLIEAYDGWSISANISRELWDEVVLNLRAELSERSGGTTTDASVELPIELTADYRTFFTEARVSWPLFSDITVDTYATYGARESDAESLEYGRYAAGFDCTYSYEF